MGGYHNNAGDIIAGSNPTLGAAENFPRLPGMGDVGTSFEALEFTFEDAGDPEISTDGTNYVPVAGATVGLRAHVGKLDETFPNLYIKGTGACQIRVIGIRGYDAG